MPSSRLLPASAALAALVTLSSPAFAIPSPELVVGSISSISQLLALLSALLGGGALAVGRRASGRNATTSVWQSRLSMVAYALLAVMIGLNIDQFQDHQSERQARLEATLVRP